MHEPVSADAGDYADRYALLHLSGNYTYAVSPLHFPCSALSRCRTDLNSYISLAFRYAAAFSSSAFTAVICIIIPGPLASHLSFIASLFVSGVFVQIVSSHMAFLTQGTAIWLQGCLFLAAAFSDTAYPDLLYA